MTYLVEAYIPCFLGDGKVHIRARKVTASECMFGDYRDFLSSDVTKFAIVNAPSIDLARQSFLTMGKFEGKPVIVHKRW